MYRNIPAASRVGAESPVMSGWRAQSSTSSFSHGQYDSPLLSSSLATSPRNGNASAGGILLGSQGNSAVSFPQITSPNSKAAAASRRTTTKNNKVGPSSPPIAPVSAAGPSDPFQIQASSFSPSRRRDMQSHSANPSRSALNLSSPRALTAPSNSNPDSQVAALQRAKRDLEAGKQAFQMKASAIQRNAEWLQRQQQSANRRHFEQELEGREKRGKLLERDRSFARLQAEINRAEEERRKVVKEKQRLLEQEHELRRTALEQQEDEYRRYVAARDDARTQLANHHVNRIGIMSADNRVKHLIQSDQFHRQEHEEFLEEQKRRQDQQRADLIYEGLVTEKMKHEEEKRKIRRRRKEDHMKMTIQRHQEIDQFNAETKMAELRLHQQKEEEGYNRSTTFVARKKPTATALSFNRAHGDDGNEDYDDPYFHEFLEKKMSVAEAMALASSSSISPLNASPPIPPQSLQSPSSHSHHHHHHRKNKE